MKNIFLVFLFTTATTAFSQSFCPEGFEPAKGSQKLKELDDNFMLVMNNDKPVVGEGKYDGVFSSGKHGMVDFKFKQKLAKDQKLEAHEKIKIKKNLESWSPELCGFTSMCLLVDHPLIKSIEISSKKDDRVEDLKATGIEICKKDENWEKKLIEKKMACPDGFHPAKDGQKIEKLNKDFMIILNNKSSINGDDEVGGAFTGAKHGLVRFNYKEKLKKEQKIEPYTKIKVLSNLKAWSAGLCGIGSKCLLVEHEHIRSIEIDSKKDKKVKDLRAAGLQVCKADGSESIAKENHNHSDRSIAGEKSWKNDNSIPQSSAEKASKQ